MTVLETGRFRLRPPTSHDVPALVEHWRDGAVREYLWDDKLVDVRVVEAVVAASESDHATSGWGGWVIRTRDEEAPLVGWCGLRVGPPDGSAASELLVELTYSLVPTWWRTGATVEASTAVLDHAFANSTLDEVFGGVDAPNLRSVATLRRLGFVPDREVQLDVGPTPYWRLGRADWLDRRHRPA
ncbi:MAG TPA: GNAT family N-acetyltransferase [Microthrixaceae bacterium]|nr:GNAT family N-acetyltransferase [Microthrixaceae bacterium]